MGPQGIPGPQGSAATIGAVECSTRTISAGDSASVEVSVDGTNLHFDFEIPQGAVGAQGPRGERGPQGLTGETGPRGPQGETGSSISIAGTLTSSANLPDPETVPATTAYLVGLTAPYNLYVIVGAAGSRLWKDVGSVTPQNITVDASMSGSSQNPVQNRVVKSYVDAVKTTADIAYTRSSSNLSRINAIQNVDLPNIYYELADLKEIVFETVAAVAAYVVDPAAFFVTPSYITIDNVAYPVIDDTDAEVAEILGSTVAWNQYFTASGNNETVGVSFTRSGQKITLSGTATATASGGLSTVNVTGGHTVLIFSNFSGAILAQAYAGDTYLSNVIAGGPNSGVVTFASNATKVDLFVRLIEGTTYNETFDMFVIDLTVAIPTDTPTSLDDDRVQKIIRYALANPAYVAPALLDFKIDSITSRGFNQWDEQWEVGNIDTSTGENSASSSRIRSKNYIPVIGGGTVYFEVGNDYAGAFSYVFYDANKNRIGNGANYPGVQISVPDNAFYMRFVMWDAYGIVYRNDICINVSNPSFNGQIKPYRESSIDWESIIPDDEDRTARSAGTVRDVIYVRDDGNDTFSIVKRKVIGSYTFTGSETWAAYGSGWMANVLSGQEAVVNENSGVVPNIKYITDTGLILNSRNIVSAGGSVFSLNGETVLVGNKDNLTGKTISYELATPQETVLASGLLYDHVSFLIERGGTIAINGGMPDALPGIEIDIPVKRFNE